MHNIKTGTKNSDLIHDERANHSKMNPVLYNSTSYCREFSRIFINVYHISVYSVLINKTAIVYSVNLELILC